MVGYTWVSYFVRWMRWDFPRGEGRGFTLVCGEGWKEGRKEGRQEGRKEEKTQERLVDRLGRFFISSFPSFFFFSHRRIRIR